jgi:hypothetical protein
MSFTDFRTGYESFTRRLASKAALRVDQLLNTPRRIRTETTNFVLGAEAMPAPIMARSYRR